MRGWLPKLTVCVFVSIFHVLPAQAAAPIAVKRLTPTCAGLAAAIVPQSQVLSASLVPAGTLSIPGVPFPGFASLPEFCRVIVESTPSTDSQIGIEVWLPASGWNGRFLGTGNGGFGGSLNYSQMADALYYGYATAGTDTGHASTIPTDASWALGHPQKVIDFGFRAVHEMTVAGVALAQDFYGKAPAHKYFAGCSDGGREALMEAQRYPLDYNGILAGDPANNWTGLLANGAVNLLALTEHASSYISAAKLPAITAAVLAQCNQGVATGYLNNPAACKFNPQTLLCKGVETASCLTQPEIVTLNEIYAGAATSTGTQVFPGLVPGSEDGTAGWSGWVTGSAPGTGGIAEYVQNYYPYMVYGNPNWNYESFNLASGLAQSVAATGYDLNAVAPSLPGFRAANAKLILYHGWDDPAISPWNTIDYYEAVVAAVGQTAANKTVQLFMVPGMAHCQGGPGPTNFGQGGPGPATAAYDQNHSIYKALEAWVENGVVPKQIETNGTTTYNGQSYPLSRPLCAYPKIAIYSGSGNSNLASSYVCSAP